MSQYFLILILIQNPTVSSLSLSEMMLADGGNDVRTSLASGLGITTAVTAITTANEDDDEGLDRRACTNDRHRSPILVPMLIPKQTLTMMVMSTETLQNCMTAEAPPGDARID